MAEWVRRLFSRRTTVAADDLVVGDTIELPTENGPVVIQLATVQPRTETIKVTGRSEGGGLWSTGFTYGQTVIRLSD